MRVPTLAPEELRRRQLAALSNWVMAGAKVQPVVLAFEDLHWADPTTLDVLRGIAERGALTPLLIVATTRPEFRAPWGMRSHHGTISLAPLDRLQVRDMVAELSARHALPLEVVEDVAARTGGVPLFVAFWQLIGPVLLGWAHAVRDKTAAGWEELRRALTACNAQNLYLLDGALYPLLAAGQAQLGQFDAALATIGRVVDEAERNGQRAFVPEAHRVRGEILLKRNSTNSAPAEEAFLAAIAIARQQKARSFGLRAAMSMARLWRDQGKRQQARELLAPLYGWFTEGFHTLDLREAKALLDGLHA